VSKIIEVSNLSKNFGSLKALDKVSFAIEQDGIYGLVGRNGAGKTTLLEILTSQTIASEGEVTILGQNPYENSYVMSNIAFIKEAQRYPDNILPKVKDVLGAAALLFENWDQGFADQLLADFRLDLKRKVRKLSKGQTAALGVVIGLASRAPITIFDEPYSGMDPVARQLFYDRLLTDYAENPRTIIFSTHLVDEAADLLEHIIVLESGRVILDAATEELRGQAAVIEGPMAKVREVIESLEVLELQEVGSFGRAFVNQISQSQSSKFVSEGLNVQPISLQQLIISKTKQNSNLEMESAK